VCEYPATLRKEITRSDVKLECIYASRSNTYYTDECKLWRRNNPVKKEDSKVCFFDYKRFLPETADINSDSDFIRLYNKYNNLNDEFYSKIKECRSNGDLIISEKEDCIDKARNDAREQVIAYATGGIEKENKEIAIAKQKEDEQKAKFILSVKDCMQAYDKVAAKEEQKAKLIKEHGLDEIDGRVVDFANDGVFIENNKKRIFVYTTDKNYANDESFRDKGLLYKRDGNYKYSTITGATHSVPAYRATQYKNEDIFARTYLKDKSLKCCASYSGRKVVGVRINPDDAPRDCFDDNGKKFSEWSSF
jgi:hypothetical protein